MTQVSGIEVRFTGNTSDLEKSVGRAQGAISTFAKTAAASLAGALSVGMFVAAGRAALNFADDIGKMAQKVGMSTEALSKLTYAAKLADVSMQELQVGVQQLSKNMEAGSEGLAALGISATDSAGNLRSTAEVFADVADAFAGMEDGAGKTAIAMNIFGRSGAQLIPLLNSGRRGLNEMGDEAQRLGVVISGDAARAAETFNDNITRLQEAMNGISQEVMRDLLPSLVSLTEALLEMVKAGSPVRQFLSDTVAFFEEWGPSLSNTRREIESITEALRYMGILDPKPMEIDIAGGGLPTGPASVGAKRKAPSLSSGAAKVGTALEFSDNPSQEPGTALSDRLDMIREQFKSEREVLEEEYALNQQVLDNALMNKQMKEEEYRRLTEQLERDHQSALGAIRQSRLDDDLAAASSFFGSMAQAAQAGGKRMIKVGKAMAAAQAIIGTIQAAVHAMTDPTAITPMQKFANYAAVFAKGMSAVAAIRGVSENGGGGRVGGAGGGGGRGGGGATGGAPAAAAPTTTFQFTLMNDPMGFGEKFARQFIDQLNSTQRNGGQIRGVIA
jgi:hypothetical protein